MTKSEIIKYSIITLGTVAGIILLVSLFTAYKNKSDGSWKEVIKAKDETIKEIRVQRDIYKDRIVEIGEELQQHFKNDSLLATQSKRLTIKYESIPNNINSLDREGLRAAGERAAQ